MRDVFLAIGREGLLIARAAAEGDDDDFSLFGGGGSAHKGAGAERGRAECQPGSAAQKITPAAAEMLAIFLPKDDCASH